MNLFSKYGIKEVADVVFYSITKVGDEEFYTPVLFLDTLKVSTLEKSAEKVSAQGGLGNKKLISWNFGKEITLTLEDALFSPASMSMIWGGKLNSKLSQYTSAIVKANIANKYGKLHYSTKAYPSPAFTDEEWEIVYQAATDEKIDIPYEDDVDNFGADLIFRGTFDEEKSGNPKIQILYLKKMDDFQLDICKNSTDDEEGALYIGAKYYSNYTDSNNSNIDYVENHFLNDKVGYTVKRVIIDPIKETKEVSYIDVAYKANDYYYDTEGKKVTYDGQKIGFFRLNNGEPELTFNKVKVGSRKECLWDNYDKNKGITAEEKLNRATTTEIATIKISDNKTKRREYFSLITENTGLDVKTVSLPEVEPIPYIFKDNSLNEKYYIQEARTNLRKAYFKRQWEFEPYQYILQEQENTEDQISDQSALPKSIINRIVSYIDNIKKIGEIEHQIVDLEVIDRMERCIVTKREGLIISTSQQKENLLRYYQDDQSSSYVIYYDAKTMEPLLSLSDDGTIRGWDDNGVYDKDFDRITDTDTFKLRIGTVYYKWSRTVKYKNGEQDGVLGKTFVIDADTFPEVYKIVGETYVRNQKTGRDERMQFVVNRAQVNSDTSVTLQAEGDPTTFSMSVDVLTPPNDIMIELKQFDVDEDKVHGGTRILPQHSRYSYTHTDYNMVEEKQIDNEEIY